MPLSRRNLLRNLGAGALAGAAAPALRGLPLPAGLEAALWGNSAPTRGSVKVEPLLLYRNENPYGPSEKVLAVLRESASDGNRYPRTEYDTLLDQLAELHHVKREQIVLGCGSGEILCMAAMAFLKPGKKLVEAAPTFPALGKLAQTAFVEVADVPLNSRYEHDLPAMLDRIISTHAPSPAPSAGPFSSPGSTSLSGLTGCSVGADATGLVYIVNPNNPTGTLTPRKDIEAFIAKLPPNVTVLIDEAYHHFVAPGADYESFLDRPIADPRVIVARTFSKIYGLAGMRIGYAVATPENAKRLAAGFPAWSVSVVSARAASAALDDLEYVRLGIQRNTADRQEFMKQAAARNLRPIASQTNFIMMNPQRPPDEVIAHLKKRNILIGPKYPVLDKYVRISLGQPDEMKIFWDAWDELPPATKTSA
jgi:histidinol-phosphate aminotransferase